MASVGFAAGVWLQGQDFSSVVVCYGHPTRQQEFAAILLAAVVLCGYWWFLSWLTRRRLKHIGWGATRIVWPTAAVAVALLAAAEGMPATLALPVVAVNLPPFPVAFLVGWLFALGLPWWIVLPAATVAAWFCWWAIIVFFERRARDTGPVTLSL